VRARWLLLAGLPACTLRASGPAASDADGGATAGVDAGSGGDACAEPCILRDPDWPCQSSEYQGEQYWTCDPTSGALHRCDDEGGIVIRCERGCRVGPPGTDDVCRMPGETTIEMPAIELVISGGLFAESDVRGPVEDGVAYMLDRIAAHLDVAPGASVPDITVSYSPSANSYCSGLAHPASTEIECPYGYPITGDNQNFVVNITVHEIGHIAAQALIAPPSTRDDCENEGVATWLAGRYWMNYASTAVPSLREAARREIAAGRAVASMTDCVLASDPYYKVYGSFFEYLEDMPGAIEGVASGAVSSAGYVEGWRAWLAE
jgi:hypothetical protein